MLSAAVNAENRSPVTETVLAVPCCLPRANISAGDWLLCTAGTLLPPSRAGASLPTALSTAAKAPCIRAVHVSRTGFPAWNVKATVFPSGGALVSMVKKMYYHKCCLSAQSWLQTKQAPNPAKSQHLSQQKQLRSSDFFFQEPACFQKEWAEQWPVQPSPPNVTW